MRIEPVSPALGCEISGIDLAHPLTKSDIQVIHQALLDYCVVFFREQELSPAQQLAFCTDFGEPDEYPFVKGYPDYPTVTPVIKRPEETVNFGGLWHSDTTYLPCPPLGTVLHAKELPPLGGDTLFANMYLAYETLSDGLKEMLSGLKAINSAHKDRVSDTRSHRIEESGRDVSEMTLEAVHPVVRTHPETGRKALYVNGAHTVRFEGLTESESANLLAYLYRHQTREEFTCRFTWSEGAIAFWDNRCTQHFPLNDYPGYSRVMNRVTLKGDVPH